MTEGEAELFGELGKPLAGAGFGLPGLGEVLGMGGRQGFDPVLVSGVNRNAARLEFTVRPGFGDGGRATCGGGLVLSFLLAVVVERIHP